MQDFYNKTTGTLSVGGKDYLPGAKMTLKEETIKNDPTVDWWIRQGFISTDEKSPLGQPAFIPTIEESQSGRTVEVVEKPVAPASEPVKASPRP